MTHAIMPQRYRYSCDACFATEETGTACTPVEWGELVVTTSWGGKMRCDICPECIAFLNVAASPDANDEEEGDDVEC